MSDLADLLARHRPALVRFFQVHGAMVRRHEAAEDLAQGVHLHALRHADLFTYRGEDAFMAWLLQLARQHLAARIVHWKALKRDGGKVLRITLAGTGGVDPGDDATGPATWADRRDRLRLATRAMDGLPPRDREILRYVARGADVADIAAGLNLSPAAAQRARHRALERFRKVYDVLRRGP